jgi:hypothetical protein
MSTSNNPIQYILLNIWPLHLLRIRAKSTIQITSIFFYFVANVSFHRLVWPLLKYQLIWVCFFNNIADCLHIVCLSYQPNLIQQLDIVILEYVQASYMHNIKYKVSRHVKSKYVIEFPKHRFS